MTKIQRCAQNGPLIFVNLDSCANIIEMPFVNFGDFFAEGCPLSKELQSVLSLQDTEPSAVVENS